MDRVAALKAEAVAVAHRVPLEHKAYTRHIHNNIMLAVMGNIELALADGVMTTRARDHLEKALAAAKRLNSEINLMML
ncbi:MAG: hypothetical protein WC657_08410 [Candidatus Paceibacterota bacterium]|jgi:hypothetical protein